MMNVQCVAGKKAFSCTTVGVLSYGGIIAYAFYVMYLQSQLFFLFFLISVFYDCLSVGALM